MIKSKEDMIQGIPSIMDSFDFNKVRGYMTDTNWQWRGEGVPTIDELKRTAVNLLVEALEDKAEFTSLGTGGFRVYKFPWGLEIVFTLERKGTF
jgi:hypothetical protein